MVWTRPDKPAIPTVFHTFQAKDVDSDRLVTYRVEDLTEDRHEDMVQHYLEHLLNDEPLSRNRRLSEDEVSRAEVIALLRWCFSLQTTIVCYKEGSSEIVGANLLEVKTIENKEFELSDRVKSDRLKDILAINRYMMNEVNPFERYGVDKYLTAHGLAINRRYRRRGIATEILKARVPMCKAFGIKLTATNFTAFGAQQAAQKAGFTTDLEVSYDDFAKMGPRFSFPGIDTKSLKLMSLKIE